MINWASVFHFYQPPTQENDIIKEVVDSTYLPFLYLIKDNPELKVTLNISGSLTLQLNELSLFEMINLIKELVTKGQVEFVRSPIYHALIPLLPIDVSLRQIEYNSGVIEYFYNAQPLSVLFPPELAMDQASLDKMADRYQYCLLDDSALSRGVMGAKYHSTTLIPSSRKITDIIRAYPSVLKNSDFDQWLSGSYPEDATLVSVNDVEVFGHHYEERLEFLKNTLKSESIKLVPLSEALERLSQEDIQHTDNFISTSWSTKPEDLSANLPYRLWKNPDSELQTLYWNLIELAHYHLSQTPEPVDDEGLRYSSAQKHFDKGVSSCHTYWLSNWPWWNPMIVEEGAQQLIRCIRSLPRSNEEKQQAEEQYSDFIKSLWRYHWSDKPEKEYARYNAYYQSVIESLPF